MVLTHQVYGRSLISGSATAIASINLMFTYTAVTCNWLRDFPTDKAGELLKASRKIAKGVKGSIKNKKCNAFEVTITEIGLVVVLFLLQD